MSDWEDEYDAVGVAVQKPVANPAPAQWKLPCGDRKNVFFDVQNETRFGASREAKGDGRDEGTVRRGWRGGGRQFTGRTYNDNKLDSSPSVTITVENASVGRIIGRIIIK